jgi:hypothetical protein
MVLGALDARAAFAADQDSVDQLMRELEAMKRRVEKIEQQTREQQETIRKQNETIKKLTGQQAAPPTAAPAPAVATEAPSTGEETLEKRVEASVLRRIQPSLTAANKTFASQFNPAIGLIIDTVASQSEKDRANFEMRSAEIGISGSVDPFVRGYAILNGTQDGFEVEEAAIVTTSLPYNLNLKGGRFFADFGRLSKFHDHDLPFVNRPKVLDEYVGGESQADGVETSWLAPISHYLTLTAGAYNKIGAENERVSNLVPRNYSEFTYLGKAFTFLSLSDANSADLGISYAYTPDVKEDGGSHRNLWDLELTYRYTPLSQAGYRGLVWGSELLYNQERRPVGDSNSGGSQEFRLEDAFGMYSYLEARLTRRFYPGFLFQYVQNLDDASGAPSLSYSPYLTVWASEFQRLRFQYTYLDEPGQHDNQFFLQWTVILGSHVHSFKDR